MCYQRQAMLNCRRDYPPIARFQPPASSLAMCANVSPYLGQLETIRNNQELAEEAIKPAQIFFGPAMVDTPGPQFGYGLKAQDQSLIRHLRLIPGQQRRFPFPRMQQARY